MPIKECVHTFLRTIKTINAQKSQKVRTNQESLFKFHVLNFTFVQLRKLWFAYNPQFLILVTFEFESLSNFIFFHSGVCVLVRNFCRSLPSYKFILFSFIVVSVCWYVTSVVHYLPTSSEGAPLSQLLLGMYRFFFL